VSKNEKLEQHIRKKTHKPNTLRFCVEGGVISLCGFGSVLIQVHGGDWLIRAQFDSFLYIALGL